MKVSIITKSSYNGLNQKQAMECYNLLLSSNNDVKVYLCPDEVIEKFINESDRIIFIVPEWNGSFPYSMKKLVDDSYYPSTFKNKKILLIGTSASTFGNIMGISHFKYILEFVGASVYPKLICVPFIEKKFANNDIQVDERLNEAVIDFCKE